MILRQMKWPEHLSRACAGRLLLHRTVMLSGDVPLQTPPRHSHVPSPCKVRGLDSAMWLLSQSFDAGVASLRAPLPAAPFLDRMRDDGGKCNVLHEFVAIASALDRRHRRLILRRTERIADASNQDKKPRAVCSVSRRPKRTTSDCTGSIVAPRGDARNRPA